MLTKETVQDTYLISCFLLFIVKLWRMLTREV